MDNYKCKLCGKKLTNWKSIQRGFGPVCENKYLDDIYKNQQVTLYSILAEGEKGGNNNGK